MIESRKSAAAGGALLLLLSGCSVTALAERERSIAVNTCESSSDCVGGTFCSDTNICITENGQLQTLLFEVSPTLVAADLAGEQLFQVASNLSPRANNQLLLNGFADLRGSVTSASLAGCSLLFDGGWAQATDNSIPARLTLIPRERTWGVTASNLNVATTTPERGASAGSYPFSASVPAGTYDVYVEPFGAKPLVGMESSSELCSLPPVLYRDIELQNGATRLKLSIPAPQRLNLQVQWPEAASALDGWTVDMLEPDSGRVISTRSSPKPAEGGDKNRYVVAVDYVPVADPAADPSSSARALVRFTPPSDVVAPTLVFERAGLGLFSKDTAIIDQLGTFPEPIAFTGVVMGGAATGAPLKAEVTLSAKQLDGLGAGFQSAFIRTAQSDENGAFSVQLLPGTYTVHAVPSQPVDEGAPFAALETTIKVARGQDGQAGRAIVVEPAHAVNGRAFLANGEGALGATVVAEVDPASVTTSVYARALGEQPLVPRAVSTVIDDPGGRFTLYADPGFFRVSVRPPEGSALPWLVQPPVELGTLQSLELSLPLAVALRVSVALPQAAPMDQLQSLAGAHVRAYALLDADGRVVNEPDAAVSAIPVSEGRLETNGSVQLILPAKLDPSGNSP